MYVLLILFPTIFVLLCIVFKCSHCIVYLSPSVHGRGIMPLVLKTMIEKFMIPYMNLAQINGSYYTTNKASRRVFEKNNFAFWKEVPDLIELSELKTGVKGKKVGIGLMKWERKL